MKIIKNLILTFFLLTVSFSFANSHVDLQKINTENSIETLVKIGKTDVIYTFSSINVIKDDQFYGVGCYINIYYEGNLVETVYSYGYGSTIANCRRNVQDSAEFYVMIHQ